MAAAVRVAASARPEGAGARPPAAAGPARRARAPRHRQRRPRARARSRGRRSAGAGPGRASWRDEKTCDRERPAAYPVGARRVEAAAALPDRPADLVDHFLAMDLHPFA